jgi:hypothetical protein
MAKAISRRKSPTKAGLSKSKAAKGASKRSSQTASSRASKSAAPSPGAALKSFFTAMYSWEVAAYKRWVRADKAGVSCDPGDRQSWREYLTIFKAHCAKKAKPRSLHFGSPPEYRPRKEKIVEEFVKGKKALIKTLQTEFNSDQYTIYHLVLESDQWRLLKKYVLFDDGPFLSEL